MHSIVWDSDCLNPVTIWSHTPQCSSMNIYDVWPTTSSLLVLISHASAPQSMSHIAISPPVRIYISRQTDLISVMDCTRYDSKLGRSSLRIVKLYNWNMCSQWPVLFYSSCNNSAVWTENTVRSFLGFTVLFKFAIVRYKAFLLVWILFVVFIVFSWIVLQQEYKC